MVVLAAALDGAATAAWSRARCSLLRDGGVSGLRESAADRVACELDAVAHSEPLERLATLGAGGVGHEFESLRSFATVTSTAAVTAKSTIMIGARIHICPTAPARTTSATTNRAHEVKMISNVSP